MTLRPSASAPIQSRARFSAILLDDNGDERKSKSISDSDLDAGRPPVFIEAEH